MISRKQLGLILLPFLLVAASFYGSLNKEISIRFTPIELEMYRYKTGTVLTDSLIRERPLLKIPSEVSGPLYVTTMGVPGSAPSYADQGYAVSFILITENDKRAIINNAIVGEGDILDNRKVSRIDKDKVALTARGITTWLELEAQ